MRGTCSARHPSARPRGTQVQWPPSARTRQLGRSLCQQGPLSAQEASKRARICIRGPGVPVTCSPRPLQCEAPAVRGTCSARPRGLCALCFVLCVLCFFNEVQKALISRKMPCIAPRFLPRARHLGRAPWSGTLATLGAWAGASCLEFPALCFVLCVFLLCFVVFCVLGFFNALQKVLRSREMARIVPKFLQRARQVGRAPWSGTLVTLGAWAGASLLEFGG